MGHRIIEINGQSVVATAHEKIVQALSNSVGEVQLMLTHTQKTKTYKCSRANSKQISVFFYLHCFFIMSVNRSMCTQAAYIVKGAFH